MISNTIFLPNEIQPSLSFLNLPTILANTSTTILPTLHLSSDITLFLLYHKAKSHSLCGRRRQREREMLDPANNMLPPPSSPSISSVSSSDLDTEVPPLTKNLKTVKKVLLFLSFLRMHSIFFLQILFFTFFFLGYE